MLQQDNSTPNFHILSRLQYTFFSDLTLFPGNFSYSFHPIGLKHGGQVDYEVMQRICFEATVHQMFIVIAL